MKNKLLILTAILVFMVGMLDVAAYNDSYYYEKNDGYALCDGKQPGCFDITKGQSGVTFNNKRQEIIYEGITYYFSEDAQEEYDESKNGETQMFFYMNSEKAYVLCKKEKDCSIYTFDELMDMGASVTPESKVELNNGDGPGEPGETYYYNASYEERESKGENISGTAQTDYCTRLKVPLKFIGNIVLIAKIMIPIVIIIFGAVDFFKVITGSKDDDIKKSGRLFAFRCLAGIIVFLIPTVVSVVFSLVSDFADIKGDFNACQKCVLRVTECK